MTHNQPTPKPSIKVDYPTSATGTALLQDSTGRWRSCSGPSISLTLRLSNFNDLMPTERPVNQRLDLPLLSIDPECEVLERNLAPRDWRWAARLAWLVLLVTQCAAVLVGAVRRLTFSAANGTRPTSGTVDPSNLADSPLDQVNTLTATAGLIVGLQSVAITLLNHKWHFHETGNRERQPLVSDWQQANTDTPRLMALAFCIDMILSFRLFRNFNAAMWVSNRNSHPILTIFNFIMVPPAMLLLVVHACSSVLPRKRWKWLATLIDSQSSALPALEPCLLLVLHWRFLAVVLVVWSIQSISHCHGHHQECENPLWMWKDPVMDKLYTF